LVFFADAAYRPASMAQAKSQDAARYNGF